MLVVSSHIFLVVNLFLHTRLGASYWLSNSVRAEPELAAKIDVALREAALMIEKYAEVFDEYDYSGLRRNVYWGWRYRVYAESQEQMYLTREYLALRRWSMPSLAWYQLTLHQVSS